MSLVDILAESSTLYAKRILQPERDDVIAQALNRDAVSRRILAKGLTPEPGSVVGTRLNINVLKSQGVCVHSIHASKGTDSYRRGVGLYNNAVLAYLPVVEMADVYFNVGQAAREKIATGQSSKTPMASVDGTLLERSPNYDCDGVEIRFNPATMHCFCDLDGYAVHSAERVTVLGHRIYARGRLRYYTAASAPQRAGEAPSLARFKRVSTSQAKPALASPCAR